MQQKQTNKQTNKLLTFFTGAHVEERHATERNKQTKNNKLLTFPIHNVEDEAATQTNKQTDKQTDKQTRNCSLFLPARNVEDDVHHNVEDEGHDRNKQTQTNKLLTFFLYTMLKMRLQHKQTNKQINKQTNKQETVHFSFLRATLKMTYTTMLKMRDMTETNKHKQTNCSLFSCTQC